MSWLDIDTILAEEERLPCVFSTDCPTLGHLDKNNSNYGQMLPKGSRVELSLWLAESLAKKGMVEIEFPKHYGPKMRDQLNSSSLVNLREYSPYFFDVGLRLSHLRKDTDLLRTLRTTFSGDRFKNLMGHCLGQ